MKIQIEPRKDIMEIKSSLNKVTYLSYLSYQAVIPKAPEDVRLSDVKNAFPEKTDLEYHFKTKDLAGNTIFVEVDSYDQPIPLLDGEIKVETVPKQTEVCFRILDENRTRIINFYNYSLEHGIIPISMKKSKTLADVKEALPTVLQTAFKVKDGKSVKYFFETENDEIGLCKKELVRDTDVVPVIEGKDKIKCWIMVSPDVSENLSQQTTNLWLLLFFKCLLLILLGIGCYKSCHSHNPFGVIGMWGFFALSFTNFVISGSAITEDDDKCDKY